MKTILLISAICLSGCAATQPATTTQRIYWGEPAPNYETRTLVEKVIRYYVFEKDSADRKIFRCVADTVFEDEIMDRIKYKLIRLKGTK